MKVKRRFAVLVIAVMLFCVSGCGKDGNVQIYDADGELAVESGAEDGGGDAAGDADASGAGDAAGGADASGSGKAVGSAGASGAGGTAGNADASGAGKTAGHAGASGSGENGETASIQVLPETAGSIFVYVCGAVENPGVVEVPAGSRVFEAVRKAGGMTAEAADFAVNQAALLTDGQQITIPTMEQAEDWTPQETAQASADTGKETESGEKVNINQAAAEELMTLPGIGEAKAAGIIEYRESAGEFQSIEEIKNVSGIGDAVFEKIKDRIAI